MSNDCSKSVPSFTDSLAAWKEGDRAAGERLLRTVYADLRRKASSYLNRERAGHTFVTRDLVHETFLRLAAQHSVSWQSREHFMGVAATMMRRILVDYARERSSQKRGRGVRLETLQDVADWPVDDDLLGLNDALDALAKKDADLATIVELRYFGGFRDAEIAANLKVSVPTVRRRFRLARAWLAQFLSRSDAK